MNTRKDNGGRAMKKWLATPPGHIAKPLKHILNRTHGAVDGRMRSLASAEVARIYAECGNGLALQAMARRY